MVRHRVDTNVPEIMADKRARQQDNRHCRLHILIGLLALLCLLGAMAPVYADAGIRAEVALVNLDAIKGKYSLAGLGR